MLSRRAFLGGSAATAVAGLSGLSARTRAWQQQAPAAPVPVFTAIRRNVSCFTARGGTIGYLVDAKGVAVVDSQFPDTAKLFLDGLNTRSKSRPVDRLINTHHHGDHTGGNLIFRGSATRVLAHAKAAEHMRQPPGQAAPAADQLFPDATFTDVWREEIGNEWIRAKFYGPAHTSGDAVITFERANVAHMGDLLFNRRHPVVDRAAGALMRNWIVVLEETAADHNNDTIYICGHANTNLPVTVGRADLLFMRDYLTAVLAFVESQVKAGKTRDEVLAMRDPLKGFEVAGPFGATGPREPLTVAYEEVTAGR